MSDKKLLPCPFCGGEVFGIADKSVPGRYLEFGRIFYHKVYVECKKCYSRGGQALGKTVGEVFDEVPSYITTIEELKKRAISNWNARKPMERIVERLEDINMTAVDLANLTCSTYQDGVVSGIERSLEIVKEEGGLNG